MNTHTYIGLLIRFATVEKLEKFVTVHIFQTMDSFQRKCRETIVMNILKKSAIYLFQDIFRKIDPRTSGMPYRRS